MLAVSSNVDNPRDFPEHLVDGRPETAWNGRSGDLKGAWISFRVPKDAHVDRIEITAGYDKVNAQGDLFTMNHRIEKVRVKRNGAVLKEQVLDTDVRKAQSIPIGTDGGTFRIEIVETRPGSKKEWREVCVSELRVIGTPSDSSQPITAAPPVGIGAFPSEAPSTGKTDDEMTAAQKSAAALVGRGWPTIADFCRAWDAMIEPVLADQIKRGSELVPKVHKCTVVGPIAAFQPSDDIKSLTRVRIFLEGWSEDRFAIETKDGFFVADDSILQSEAFLDPGCFGRTTTDLQSARAIGGSTVIVLKKSWRNTRHTFKDDGMTPESTFEEDDISRHELRCAIAGSRMRCSEKELDRVCHVGKEVVDCKSF